MRNAGGSAQDQSAAALPERGCSSVSCEFSLFCVESNVREKHTASDSLRILQDGNTIVHLDTGMGKTMIAVKVIDDFLTRHPGKKVFFVVHTVDLVDQQVQFMLFCLCLSFVYSCANISFYL